MPLYDTEVDQRRQHTRGLGQADISKASDRPHVEVGGRLCQHRENPALHTGNDCLDGSNEIHAHMTSNIRHKSNNCFFHANAMPGTSGGRVPSMHGIKATSKLLGDRGEQMPVPIHGDLDRGVRS